MVMMRIMMMMVVRLCSVQYAPTGWLDCYTDEMG